MAEQKLTIPDITARKGGQPLSMLTAYDWAWARIQDKAGIDMLLVGDSLSSDIRGARNAGIRSCWFNPRGEAPRPDIPADFEIRCLEELPPLLERIFPM